MLENQISTDSGKIVDNVMLNVNKLVENKKLQLNYIWSNKITQEELNTPKILDDSQQNNQLTNKIFQSILKFANKINEVFKVLICSDQLEEEKAMKLLVLTGSLIQKFKNFFQVKTKQFKIQKSSLEPLIKLEENYNLFKSNLPMPDISKKLEDFQTCISDFNSLLEEDGHLK